MKPIDFELTTEVKYASGGGETGASFITLNPPTGKVSHICCEIESLIQGGILKMQGLIDKETLDQAKSLAEATKDTDEKMDREAVLAIMSGGGADMKKMVVNFRELFREVALIDGEKPLTVPMMEKMSHTDFKSMMGEYAANFILD